MPTSVNIFLYTLPPQVAMVEIQFSKNQVGDLPEPLLILFVICTTLGVTVHMLALVMSTYILPNMEAISSLHTFRYYFIVLSFYSQLKICTFFIAWSMNHLMKRHMYGTGPGLFNCPWNSQLSVRRSPQDHDYNQQQRKQQLP